MWHKHVYAQLVPWQQQKEQPKGLQGAGEGEHKAAGRRMPGDLRALIIRIRHVVRSQGKLCQWLRPYIITWPGVTSTGEGGGGHVGGGDAPDLDYVCSLTDFHRLRLWVLGATHKMYLTHNLCLHEALKFTARRQDACFGFILLEQKEERQEQEQAHPASPRSHPPGRFVCQPFVLHINWPAGPSGKNHMFYTWPKFAHVSE